jgi:hypothetical protein
MNSKRCAVYQCEAESVRIATCKAGAQFSAGCRRSPTLIVAGPRIRLTAPVVVERSEAGMGIPSFVARYRVAHQLRAVVSPARTNLCLPGGARGGRCPSAPRRRSGPSAACAGHAAAVRMVSAITLTSARCRSLLRASRPCRDPAHAGILTCPPCKSGFVERISAAPLCGLSMQISPISHLPAPG